MNFRGTNTEALELDARGESLVDKKHEQSLKVFIRQPVSFGTKNIFTNTKKSLTCCAGWDTLIPWLFPPVSPSLIFPCLVARVFHHVEYLQSLSQPKSRTLWLVKFVFSCFFNSSEEVWPYIVIVFWLVLKICWSFWFPPLERLLFL